MKPLPFATICRALFLSVLVSALFSLRAHAAPTLTCGSGSNQAPVPATHATAYAATSPNLVSVIDATTNSVVCTVTVGPNPGNLAASPDSKYLFVENDGDGSVTVVDLNSGSPIQTIALGGLSTGMTANLAVSPDNSKVYVVTLPAPLTPSPQASLYIIPLPLTPSTVATGPISVGSTPVTGPGLGVGFSWDSSTALIATEGALYTVNTSTVTTSANAISTLAGSGGSVAMDEGASIAYVVDVSTMSGGSTLTKVDLTTPTSPTVTTTTATSPLCTQANAIATPHPVTGHALAFYSCASPSPASLESVDFASGTPSTAFNSVAVSNSASAHPQGLFISSDGNLAYVALDDGTIAIVSSPTIANPTLGTPINLGAPVRGIVQRPVLVSISPLTPNVPTGATQQFTGAVKYAFSASPTLTWGVSGVISGSPGTISPLGLYTAPKTFPSPRTVTISAANAEIPPKLPATATATVTSSLLVFQAQPTNVMAGGPFSVVVYVADANGSPDPNDNTTSLTISSSSTPSGAAPISVAGATPPAVTAVAGVVTFSNLILTQVATTPIPNTPYNYTLAVAVNSGPPNLASISTTPTFTIAPGPASQLFFGVQPASGAVAGTALNGSSGVVVWVEDANNNVLTSVATNVLVSLTVASTLCPSISFDPKSTLSVTAANAVAFFGNLIIDRANIPPASGSTTVTTCTDLLTASATFPAPIGTLTTRSNPFFVIPAAAAQLAFTTQPAGGSLGGNTAALPNVIVCVEDTSNNVATGWSAPIVMSSSNTAVPTSAGGSVSPTLSTLAVTAPSGVAQFNSLFFQTTGAYNYSLTATSAGLANQSVTSNPFKLTTAITVSVASGASANSSLLQGETSAANALATGLANSEAGTVTGDPNNNGGLGVTWSIICPVSPASACGSISASGQYTAPMSLPVTTNPSLGLPVTITATSVADTSKSSGTSYVITVFPDLFLTSGPGGLQSFTTNPPAIAIAPGSSVGSVNIALLGPISGSFIFTCSNFSSGLTQPFCGFSATSGTSGTVTPSGNGVSATVTPGASSTTLVQVSLGITRSSTTSNFAPKFRFLPRSGPAGGAGSRFSVGFLLSVACLGLVFSGLLGRSLVKARHSFALVFLIVLVLGWVTACAQFGQPPFPAAPSTGVSGGSGSGTFTLTITPKGTNAGSFNAITIPTISVTVN